MDQDGEPWFVARDVCDVLGLTNLTESTKSLDSDELDSVQLKSGSQNRRMVVVNEPGLYGLIMKSRKPEAQAFKRWVKWEVLPSIRKHGAYVTPATTEEWLTDLDRMIEVLTALKKERAEKALLEPKQELRGRCDGMIFWKPLSIAKKIKTPVNRHKRSSPRPPRITSCA